MVVERQPTSLPDFHADDMLIEELRQILCDSTGELRTKELEQLHATCLGNVWHHQAKLDHNALVKEL
jgi:ATPase family AAA domain-containing protein 2